MDLAMNRNFDPHGTREAHRERQDPLQDLDNLRSSAAYTHGSALGGLAYFFLVLIVWMGRLVRGTLMLPVRLLGRRRDYEVR
jgi:hypothetical protein